MGRLIKKAEQVQDPYLGQLIEITNPDSKYLGYFGVVNNITKNDEYKVSIYPQEYENTNKMHSMLVDTEDAGKWFRVVNPEDYQ